MKPWIFMIFTCFLVQAFGMYGCAVVFNSVENAFGELNNIQTTDRK